MDLGTFLASQQSQAPTANPHPPGTGGYNQWMLAQSRMPPPPQRQFSIPLSFRPNRTAPNQITASPAPLPQSTPGGIATPTSPPAPTSKIATSPLPTPVKPMSTPFSSYLGKSVGNPAGQMSTTPGFSS